MKASHHLHRFSVTLPGPLDIPRSFDVFRRSGDDRIDRWDGHVLVRTTRIDGQIVPYSCHMTGDIDTPSMSVTVAQGTPVVAIDAVVRHMFVTAPAALETLMSHDPQIAELETRFRGLRPVLQAEPFTAIVRSITAQQVNLKWAATTRRRLAEGYGRRYALGSHEVIALEPERLAAASVEDLRALQFTTRKSEYLIGLAQAVVDGALDLKTLQQATDAEVIERLTALRGLGRWTAEWFLARALGRPRVVAGDLGVRKAIGAIYLQGRMPSETEVRDCTAHWGAAAGVAQQLVLQTLVGKNAGGD
ncbi:DNA-3-methyladenine glycosylase family protein [Candidatus Entotheonella palauensis]|nr:DNA-3-methyladenine glycosylase 2 family protein [Candidatus Entotheonella palauensis]